MTKYVNIAEVLATFSNHDKAAAHHVPCDDAVEFLAVDEDGTILGYRARPTADVDLKLWTSMDAVPCALLGKIPHVAHNWHKWYWEVPA